VRERPWRQRKTGRRPLPHDIAQAVRAADHDRDIARPLALLLEPRSELLGRHGFSDYIACDNLRTGGKGREQPLPFPLTDEVRGAGTCRFFADLMDL